MIDSIRAASVIAGAGMEAQSTRLRIVAENIANARSTGATPGGDPYSRKTVTFESALREEFGIMGVSVKDVSVDRAPFIMEHDPGNPAADAQGNVKMPNVNMMLEMADMREASRSYEANLQVVKQARGMAAMTIDLLRST